MLPAHDTSVPLTGCNNARKEKKLNQMKYNVASVGLFVGLNAILNFLTITTFETFLLYRQECFSGK